MSIFKFSVSNFLCGFYYIKMQNCGYNCTYQMTPEANYNATKRGAVADTDMV